jgi:hypothetical protein
MTAGQIIMVQVANTQWNCEALHCACILARRNVAKLALVKMIPVQHTSWLGTEWGGLNLSLQDSIELEECKATAQDYGVKYSTHLFQYLNLSDALVEAADYVKADVVFATLPKHLLPWWKRMRMDYLHCQLARQQRVLFDETSLLETDSMLDRK